MQIDPKDPNVMLVTSNWIEPGAAGMPGSEYEVVWALIKEVDGWRICEMAVDTHTEGEEVQVVNFENLTEVVGESTGERTAALPAGSTQAPPPPANTPALPALPSGPGQIQQPGTGLPALPPSSGPSLPSVPPPAGPAGLPPLGGAGN